MNNQLLMKVTAEMQSLPHRAIVTLASGVVKSLLASGDCPTTEAMVDALLEAAEEINPRREIAN